MESFKPAKGPSLKTIFTKSIKEIEKGLWICGELCQLSPTKTKIKHMACAVGLVSLHGGNTRERKRKFYFEDLDKHLEFLVKEATYPEDQPWNSNSVKALRLLLENAPKGSKVFAKMKLVAADAALITPSSYAWAGPEDSWQRYGQLLSDGVVRINDTALGKNKEKAALKAAAWFKDAARAGGVDV